MATDAAPDGYLFDLYRKYIGEPDGRNDVYVGFGLFFGGIALAFVTLVLFLWGSTHDAHTGTYYAWIQPAYALGMLSLPATMLGIVVLLPSERRMLYASVVGTGITVAAIGGFVYAYPTNWHFVREVDYTVEVVATYAIGLAGLTASTGAALIAHYLEIARTASAVEESKSDDGTDEPSESYTSAEIESDIEAAMEDVELSWGGVEKTEHRRLTFSNDEFDDVDVDVTTTAKTVRSSGVEDQVAGLKGLKGGETKTKTSSSSVDDQTAKLKELREQQRAEQLAEAPKPKRSAVGDALSDRVESVKSTVKTIVDRK